MNRPNKCSIKFNVEESPNGIDLDITMILKGKESLLLELLYLLKNKNVFLGDIESYVKNLKVFSENKEITCTGLCEDNKIVTEIIAMKSGLYEEEDEDGNV